MDNNEPKICRDCQVEFTLTPGELDYYTKKMAEEPEFQMPKRCPPCRAIKKKQRAMERGPAHAVRLEPHPQYGMVAKDSFGNGYAFKPKPRREYPKNDGPKQDPDEFLKGL